MRIHREGYRIIVWTLVTITALCLAAFSLFTMHGWVMGALLIAGLLLLTGVAAFFRVPVRNAAYDDNKIFSGADGKVVVIEEVFEDEFFKDKRLQISVFMSVTNVHVNYAPLSGTVKYFKYHPGKFLFAWLPKSSTENERTSFVIENKVVGPVLIRQIAGAFARRIVCYAREKNIVSQGSEVGIIKFGSRVDLFLPCNSQVHVKLNQHVRGGETLMASLNEI